MIRSIHKTLVRQPFTQVVCLEFGKYFLIFSIYQLFGSINETENVLSYLCFVRPFETTSLKSFLGRVAIINRFRIKNNNNTPQMMHTTTKRRYFNIILIPDQHKRSEVSQCFCSFYTEMVVQRFDKINYKQYLFTVHYK